MDGAMNAEGAMFAVQPELDVSRSRFTEVDESGGLIRDQCSLLPGSNGLLKARSRAQGLYM